VANPWIYIIFNDQILCSLRDLLSSLFSRYVHIVIALMAS
jgi:hypothetical protein